MTMTRTTKRITNDPYFDWLCRKAGIGGDGRPYILMASLLHQLLFRTDGAIETDSNRVNDGLQLRVQFIERYGLKGSSDNRGPCTMLEFLIGLAKRMSFLTENEEHAKTKHYFWRLIDNLRLGKLSDDVYERLNGDFFVEEAVNRVLERTYDACGNGGLFPVKMSQIDQRNVEIWYQMQQWLLENANF